MSEKEQTHTPISNLGEFGLIDQLTRNFSLHHPQSILGIGDDAAVLDFGQQKTVVSTDLLMEGVHFDLMYSPFKHLGYKAVIVNLSDIYAMNAQPLQFTFSIAISSKFTLEALEALYDGVATACKHYGVDLIGGDTSNSLSGMAISVTAIGITQNYVCRSTAQVGDYIVVSGDLGAAYLGLQLLEREKRIFLENPAIQPALQEHTYLIERQLKPEARRDLYEWFKAQNITPTAMIDISDGLSSDILHICKQSKVGCVLFEDNIPLHPQTIEVARQFNISPTTCALNGGEDYELLFCINPKDLSAVENVEGLHIIGKIVDASEDCHLVSRDGRAHKLIAQGWNALHTK
ncbi:MAG: thiamine-phosphate kinase [Chitinophagales bacterium]|nr:thiamine-phosphate kinase [Bacteroidota bacterium]MCB9043854.1 thiamine-phosphate kinase [Chitinophagales bacterium]